MKYLESIDDLEEEIEWEKRKCEILSDQRDSINEVIKAKTLRIDGLEKQVHFLNELEKLDNKD
jgi:hypothetical protein